jgi:hypothetical protein
MTAGSSALVSLGLLRERLPGERRVALTPADVKRLSAKAIVTVETGAGLEAGFPDGRIRYREDIVDGLEKPPKHSLGCSRGAISASSSCALGRTDT